MNDHIINKIKDKSIKVGIIGLGYVGLPLAKRFIEKKFNVVGFDVDKEKVKKINSGTIPLKDLKKWFGFDIKGLVKQNYLKASSNYKNVITKEFLVHFIAIPTEKDGKPYFVILKKIIQQLSKLKSINFKYKPVIINACGEFEKYRNLITERNIEIINLSKIKKSFSFKAIHPAVGL